MNCFIEVTEFTDGFKLLLAVSQIKSIIEMEDGSSCIEMVESIKNKEDIIFCSDLYSNVKATLTELAEQTKK